MSERRTRVTSGGQGSASEDERSRSLGAGVAGFVAVHLLALLVLGEPSSLGLLGVEAVAVGLLLAGDAVATGRRGTLPVAAGVLAALGAVGVALDSRVPLWLVAAGLLVLSGTALYAGHYYDRSPTGGEPA